MSFFMLFLAIQKPYIGFCMVGYGWDDTYMMYIEEIQNILEDMRRFNIYSVSELKKEIDTFINPSCYIPPPDTFKFLQKKNLRYLMFVCINSKNSEIIKEKDSSEIKYYFKSYINLRLKIYDLESSRMILNRRIHGESTSENITSQNEAEENAFNSTISSIRYELRKLFALTARVIKKKGKYFIIDQGIEMGVKKGTYFVAKDKNKVIGFLKVVYPETNKSYAVLIKNFRKINTNILIKELPYGPDFINLSGSFFIDYINIVKKEGDTLHFYPGFSLSGSLGRQFPVFAYFDFNYLQNLYKFDFGFGIDILKEWRYFYLSIGTAVFITNLMQQINIYTVNKGMVGIKVKTDNGFIIANNLYIGIEGGVSLRSMNNIDRWEITSETDTIDLTRDSKYHQLKWNNFDVGLKIKYQWFLY